MNRCPDCGMPMYNGICTWCHEDIQIMNECEEYDIPVSDDFLHQYEEICERQKKYKKRSDVKLENKENEKDNGTEK